MFKKIVLCVLGTGLLVGCASTNTQEHVDRYANIWYSSRYCSEMAKHMDMDTAAKGMAWAKSAIYTGDYPSMQSRIGGWIDARRSISKSECDSVALNIRVHEQEEISNARSRASQPTYVVPTPTTTTTNCSTVMGWTHCRTY